MGQRKKIYTCDLDFQEKYKTCNTGNPTPALYSSLSRLFGRAGSVKSLLAGKQTLKMDRFPVYFSFSARCHFDVRRNLKIYRTIEFYEYDIKPMRWHS